MRVIAGAWGGRRLLGPPRGAEARPTTDRVREALFSLLGASVQGARALDLFAGTGALGIEALSRGAARVTFVEADRGLCETIQANLEALECDPDRYEVVHRDARRALRSLEGPFDLALLDPPYRLGLDREALVALVDRGLLAPGARVVVEHATKEPPALPDAVTAALGEPDTRRYGDSSVAVYSLPAPAPVPDPAPSPAPRVGRTAVYAGSFDPPTNGHFDIIRRAAGLFDALVVAVASNPRKKTLFTVEERVAMLNEELSASPSVRVDRVEGLLVDYARAQGATAVIRGLRAVADFEYEFQMACMNHHLAPGVETVFLMTAQEFFYVSSSLVKEVASFGGDVTPFLSPRVRARLIERLGRE